MDNVSFKRLERQRPVAESHDKGMVDKLLPHGLHVGSLQKILDKVATTKRQGIISWQPNQALENWETYGENGSAYDE